jgi:hypothetical protein
VSADVNIQSLIVASSLILVLSGANRKFEVAGDITLRQLANERAMLFIGGAVEGQACTLSTTRLTVAGEASGSSALNISEGATFTLAEDLDDANCQFSLNVSGVMNVSNAYFKGVVPPAVGQPERASNVVVTGTFTISHALWVGSTGVVNFTNQKTVSAEDFLVKNLSTFTVTGNGAVTTISNQIIVGDPAATSKGAVFTTTVQGGWSYEYKVVPVVAPGVPTGGSLNGLVASRWKGMEVIGSPDIPFSDNSQLYHLSITSEVPGANTNTLISIDWQDGTTEIIVGPQVLEHLYAYADTFAPIVSVAGEVIVEDNATAALASNQGSDLETEYLGSLVLGSEATLDLTSHHLVLQSSAADAVFAEVQSSLSSAFNGTLGRFQGPGITSTLAAGESSYIHALGAVLNRNPDGTPMVNAFHGIAVDQDSILIAYTYAGDATLDGKVDAFDLNAVASHWQQTGRAWNEGDYNYDGTVDAFDLNILATNWQLGVSGGTMTFEQALAQWVSANAPAFQDGSFEQYVMEYIPDLHTNATYMMLPAGGAWSFYGTAGVFTYDALPIIEFAWNATFDGANAVFLSTADPDYGSPDAGAIEQAVNVTFGGYFQLDLLVAQALYQGEPQNAGVRVLVDGQLASSITPSTSQFATYGTSSFWMGSGTHTIRLEAFTSSEYGAWTVLLDDVALHIA